MHPSIPPAFSPEKLVGLPGKVKPASMLQEGVTGGLRGGEWTSPASAQLEFHPLEMLSPRALPVCKSIFVTQASFSE